MVQMSNANGPADGQNGLSSSAKHGLISEWYSAVAMTCRRAPEPPSTRTRSRCSAQRLSVRARSPSNAGSVSCPVPCGLAPHSRHRLSRACSQPRSENPMRTSTVCPARTAPRNNSPNGRSVVSRMLSKSSRVPPSTRRRSYQSICRQPGLTTSTYSDSGTPSSTTVPWARPRPSDSTWARSGTVRPCSMLRPPQDRSSTSRPLRDSGNV
jgi:hypothetical protein